jgi:hypothetical protein
MVQMVGGKAVHDPDTARGQIGTHGRIDVSVRTCYVEPDFLEHGRQGAHGRAAHGNQVNAPDHFRYVMVGIWWHKLSSKPRGRRSPPRLKSVPPLAMRSVAFVQARGTPPPHHAHLASNPWGCNSITGEGR